MKGAPDSREWPEPATSNSKSSDPAAPPPGKDLVVDFKHVSGKASFGQQGSKCDINDGALVMRVSGRNGDYAMCCAILRAPISLAPYEKAVADVYAYGSENKVQVKLEDGPKHVFVFGEAFEPGRRQTPDYFFSDAERTWNPRQVCLAAIGNGPPRNELRLYSVTLR